MGINKNVTPVFSPWYVRDQKVGYHVFWGGSQVGDLSGGNITFYFLNPNLTEGDCFLSLTDFVILSGGASEYYLATGIGSLSDVGLAGPSGTSYLIGGIAQPITAGSVYLTAIQYSRPYYLGRIDSQSNSNAVLGYVNNVNNITVQIQLRAKIFLTPRG